MADTGQETQADRNRETLLTGRVPRELKAQATAYVKATGMSLSGLITVAVAKELDARADAGIAAAARPEADYPNPEHAAADRLARRRASAAVDAIEYELTLVRRKIRAGTVTGDDTAVISDRLRVLIVQAAVIGTLAEARAWGDR